MEMKKKNWLEVERRQQLEFRTRSRRDGTGSMMLLGRDDGYFVAFFLCGIGEGF
jgi:hypothetical protein